MGFASFSVANGDLMAGDVIRVMYTCEGLGTDIGGGWDTRSDTSLTALSVSGGTMDPAFTADVLAYTVTVPDGTTSVNINAVAANKGNQVYLSVGQTQYHRTASIPVVSGTVITVRCGEETGGTVYTLTVNPPAEPEVPVTYTVSAPAAPVGFTVEAVEGSVSPVESGGSYSFRVNVLDGYDGSNMAVKANGEPLTAENGVYTIRNITSNQAITVEGVVEAPADSDETYTTTFYGHSAQLNSFKVYTYVDGVKGNTDLLEGVEDSDSSNTQTYTTDWITHEVEGINRVLLDLTPKPIGTIEWE